MANRILCKVYIKRKPEFPFSSQQLLEIRRPFYGLEYSDDYWHSTLLKHLTSDLLIQSNVCEISSFFNLVQSTLLGLIATHVDDSLSAGTDKLDRETGATAKRFDGKHRQYNNLRFTAFP